VTESALGPRRRPLARGGDPDAVCVAGAVANVSSRQVSDTTPPVASANAPLPPGCRRGGSLSEPFRRHPRARYTAAAPPGRRRPRLAAAQRSEASDRYRACVPAPCDARLFRTARDAAARPETRPARFRRGVCRRARATKELRDSLNKAHFVTRTALQLAVAVEPGRLGTQALHERPMSRVCSGAVRHAHGRRRRMRVGTYGHR
jgi:hypothetical protein